MDCLMRRDQIPIASTLSVEMCASEDDAVQIGSVHAPKADVFAGQRLFGMAVKHRQGTRDKLEAAGEAMETRVKDLHRRVEQHRQSATSSMSLGRKNDALREMRKLKACERQIESMQAVLDAVEQQSDIMAQTKLQRDVALALGVTAKTMKKDKKLLERAESAVEGVSEMKDLSEDLTHAMEGLAGVTSVEMDEDELMNELSAMTAVDGTVTRSQTSHDAHAAEVSDKRQGGVSARLPEVPVSSTSTTTTSARWMEKQGLLLSEAQRS